MKKHGWHILSVFLLVVVVILGYFNIGLSRRVDALRAQLDEYKEKEGKSYVVERISKQMEDIAYQQKDISEKQREEAVFQMGVAEQMRIRAEEEQKKVGAKSVCEDLFSRSICLPSDSKMTDDEVNYVAKIINDIIYKIQKA